MKHLYFCRHGLSLYGLENKWAGSSDTPLAAEGKEQAKRAARQLADVHVDHIISSPLGRAHDTASIIAQEIGYPLDKIELDTRLVERHFGELEGTPFDPTIDMDELGVTGLEPLPVFLERVRQALKHIESLDADTILVVGHGSVGRAVRHLLSPALSFKKAERFANAEIVKLV
jgi:probable phosphoglycerate mutase